MSQKEQKHNRKLRKGLRKQGKENIGVLDR